jgi:hypothetical protein
MSEKGRVDNICSSVKGDDPFSSFASGKNPPKDGMHVAKKQKQNETPEDYGISDDTVQQAGMTPGQSSLVRECKAMAMSPPNNRNGNIAEWEDIVSRIQADGFH